MTANYRNTPLLCFKVSGVFVLSNLKKTAPEILAKACDRMDKEHLEFL
tara:strand:+ start:619 stop:762 length:144 start_codon:yes stop_codon:yes gene_type:complete